MVVDVCCDVPDDEDGTLTGVVSCCATVFTPVDVPLPPPLLDAFEDVEVEDPTTVGEYVTLVGDAPAATPVANESASWVCEGFAFGTGAGVVAI